MKIDKIKKNACSYFVIFVIFVIRALNFYTLKWEKIEKMKEKTYPETSQRALEIIAAMNIETEKSFMYLRKVREEDIEFSTVKIGR